MRQHTWSNLSVGAAVLLTVWAEILSGSLARAAADPDVTNVSDILQGKRHLGSTCSDSPRPILMEQSGILSTVLAETPTPPAFPIYR